MSAAGGPPEQKRIPKRIQASSKLYYGRNADKKSTHTNAHVVQIHQQIPDMHAGATI
jgi:hypothetical protein